MPRSADWYIDFISPYPYLQLASFDRFPADLQVRPRPVLFAGLLHHWEHKGPAEIPAKRSQTYRYSHWLASKRGIPFKAPPRHPFNPLPLLRLAVALDGELEAMRAMFHHVWGVGRDADDPDVLQTLASSLGINDAAAVIGDQSVKDRLRANTDEAIARGVFGVPTFVVDGQIFWGDDVTDMMLDYLDNPELFSSGELGRLGNLPVGVERRESRL